jgi:hypothetical protein
MTAGHGIGQGCVVDKADRRSAEHDASEPTDPAVGDEAATSRVPQRVGTLVTIFPLITLVVVATAPLLGSLSLVARAGGHHAGDRVADDLGGHAPGDQAAGAMAVPRSRPAAMTPSAPIKEDPNAW